MVLRTHELIAFQAQALVALERYRDASRSFPTGSYQHEVHATCSLVISPVAVAFVQWIVVEQARLVACQFLLGVVSQITTRHGSVPQAELQHLTLIR